MAEKIFFGRAGSSVNGAADYHLATGFTPSYNGVITTLRYYATASGNIKAQVYKGAEWATADQVWATAVGQPVTAGWNTVTPDPFPVLTSDTIYLSAQGSTLNCIRLQGGLSGKDYYFKSLSYALDPSDPPGAGYTFNATYELTSEAYGWEPPTVTAINNSQVVQGDTYSLTVTDAMDSQGTGLLELCDNATYASATVKAEQTITSWSDEAVSFTANTEGLTSGAECYLFLTTDLDQQNATPLAVTSLKRFYMFATNDSGKRSKPFTIYLID